MKKDRAIGLVSLALGIATMIGTMQIPISSSIASSPEPGPRLFPTIAGVLLIICGLGLILQKQKDAEPFLEKQQWKRLGVLALVFVLYCVGLSFLGFVISTPVMLFVSMTMFAGEKKLPLPAKLLYCAGVTGVIYLLFVVLFKTNIPSGTLVKAISKLL